MPEKYPRHIQFEDIPNFRDLGGLKASGGRAVAWRRVFRSAELAKMTRNDLNRLTGEIGLAAVIDLRSAFEVKRQGIGLISEAGIKYCNISLIVDGGDREANERRYKKFTNMGQFYVDLVRQPEFGKGIIEALEIIAEPRNHPVIFHCAAGKDRTGILAAVLLSVLDVAEEDITDDYCLTAAYIEMLVSRKDSEPGIARALKELPGYFWETTPESMAMLLKALKKEYGSTRGYLKENGADSTLIQRLEKALLV
jgi:protein-tyrosine phosphatase